MHVTEVPPTRCILKTWSNLYARHRTLEYKAVNNHLTILILFSLEDGREPAKFDYDPVHRLCNLWSCHRTKVRIVVRPPLALYRSYS
jgi:hypothetical protein